MKFRSVVPSFVVFGLGIFLIAGIVVLPDYGISSDLPNQHRLAILTAEYIVGDNDLLLSQEKLRNYGVAFEMLLLFVERIFVLEDSRSIHLSRHLVTHLFFLIGGLACYFLVYRLFNNRFLALFAMLLFLLHPRMYAHSFFNSKDIPFLSMFMVTLFLIFRGFRQDTIGAFLLCGTGIGILTNIRIIGIMLFAAVLAMRVCDYFFASGREEKKHILVTSGGFVFVAVLALYATWPYLWGDPVRRFIESFTVMSAFPHDTLEPFQGEFFSSLNLPFNYVPTWISITTPPVTLLLGIIGMISIFGRGFICPRDILRNTQLRFGFLLAACFMLSILAVVMMNSVLYNGWRQMYYLYAPFSVLAVFGLHESVTYSKRIRFGERIVYGLVGTGIITTVVSMMLLHPFQHLYFNFLVDRTTPEHLKREFWMGHWQTGGLVVLKHLIEQYPYSSIRIDSESDYFSGGAIWKNQMILPKEHRERIVRKPPTDLHGDYFFYVDDSVYASNARKIPTLTYKYKIYNNTIFGLKKMKSYESIVYESIIAGDFGPPVVPAARSPFDIRLDGTTLTYLDEICVAEDVAARFFLHIVPSDDADLAADRIEYGFNNLDFDFAQHGAIWDARCLAVVTLPDYGIAWIRTGQYIGGEGKLWEADFIPPRSPAVTAAPTADSTPTPAPSTTPAPETGKIPNTGHVGRGGS